MIDYKPIDEEGWLYKIDGKLIYLIDGWAYEDGEAKVVKYGLLQSDLGKYANRGQFGAIAHFYTLVARGLILTRHIFAGLSRPLCSDDCMESDKLKHIHSRKPTRDYVWQKGSTNSLMDVDAPQDKVFVVIMSKNVRHTALFPMVYGWIERWNWITEDNSLKEAPLNWVDRYDQKTFSREEEKLGNR
jgi:hypothetical protein